MMFGWGLLIVLAVGGALLALSGEGTGWLQRTDAPRPANQSGGRAPRELLDRRLAKGELDPEEYERIRTLLEG